MLFQGLLASVEHGLNRVLRLDSTALARLAHLTMKRYRNNRPSEEEVHRKPSHR